MEVKGAVRHPVGVVQCAALVAFVISFSVALLPPPPKAEGSHVTPTILATIPVGFRPERVAVDRTSNRIYVLNHDSASVSVINGSTNAVLATVDTSGFNAAYADLAVNQVTNCVYVAGFAIRVIDYDHTTPFTIPLGTDGVAVDSSRNMIYASSAGGLAVIDGVTHAITTIPLPFGVPVSFGAIAVNPSTNRVYVADSDISANAHLAQIIMVDRNANNAITPIPITVPGAVYAYVLDIQVNPETNLVYATVVDQYGAPNTSRVFVINGATNAVTPIPAVITGGTLTVNNRPDPDPDRIHVLVGGATASGQVAVLNGATNTFGPFLPLPFSNSPPPVCCAPFGIAANPNTDRVYVSRVDGFNFGSVLVVGEPGSNSPPGPALTAGRCRQPANQPPAANAGADQTVEATGPSGATVTLNGSGSTDPDGDTLTYTWTGPFGSLPGQAVNALIPLGTHTITLTVTDGKSGPVSDTVVVTVRDTTPPTLSISLSPNPLSPAKHDMVPIVATITASDAVTPSPSVILVPDISSTEDDSGVGPGDLPNDIQGATYNTNDPDFSLRAEGYGTSGTRRTYTVTYRATDGAMNSTTKSATVTVANVKPVASAGANQTLECTSASGASVALSGAGSSDADGDALTYAWSGALTGSGPTVSGTLSIGTHLVQLVVSDGFGGTSAPVSVQIVVQDTVAPTLSLGVSPTQLWPPNHQMMPISATLTMSDACGSPTAELVSIKSTEPESGLGDGDVADDIQEEMIGTNDTAFLLRAERSWSGTGRIYEITYQAKDLAGENHASDGAGRGAVGDDRDD